MIGYLCLITLAILVVFLLLRFSLNKQPMGKDSAFFEDPAEISAISFAVFTADLEQYKPLVAMFHQDHSSISVQLVSLDYIVDWSNGYALASSADVMILSDEILRQTSMLGYFKDLQPLMNADPSFQPEDFWPGLLNYCRDVNGQPVGLPVSTKLLGIFYDEVAFDNAGLPYPTPGWTLPDFQHTIHQLDSQKKGMSTYRFVDGIDLSTSILAPFITEHLEVRAGSISPEELALEAQWYIDLAATGALYPIQEKRKGLDERESFFVEHKPAMWVGMLNSPRPDNWMGGELSIEQAGFAPFPITANQGNTKTTTIWPDCAVMSSGSVNPRAAWTWINFLSKHWVPSNSIGPFGEIPARLSVAGNSGYWESLPDHAKATVEFALSHIAEHSDFPKALPLIEHALLQALSNQIDFGNALSQVQLDLDEMPEENLPARNVVIAPVSTTLPQPEKVVITYEVLVRSAEESVAFSPWVEHSVISTFLETHPEIEIERLSNLDAPSSQNWYSYLAEKTDCFSWFSYLPLYEGITQQLLNLTPFVERDSNVFLQDFDANLLDAYRVQGQLYGLPASNQPYLMYYNADLLNRLGIEPPSQDWTFHEFLQLSSQVASTGENEQYYGFLYPIGDSFIFNGLGNTGFDLLADPPTVQLNTVEMEHTLHQIGSMVQEGILLPYEDPQDEDLQRRFLTGKIAFWISPVGQPNGPFFLQIVPDFQIVATPLPKLTVIDDFTDPGLYRGHFISRHSPNQEACWTWIQFLSTQPSAFSGIPARRSVALSTDWEIFVGEENARIFRQVGENLPPIQEPEQLFLWLPLEQWRREAIAQILQGGNPHALLTAAQYKAEKYLACLAGYDLIGANQQESEQVINTCISYSDQF